MAHFFFPAAEGRTTGYCKPYDSLAEALEAFKKGHPELFEKGCFTSLSIIELRTGDNKLQQIIRHSVRNDGSLEDFTTDLEELASNEYDGVATWMRERVGEWPEQGFINKKCFFIDDDDLVKNMATLHCTHD